MCKYEMDPASTVEDTERTRFCLQMDGRTDGQGETSIPPSTLLRGYNNGDSYTYKTASLVNRGPVYIFMDKLNNNNTCNNNHTIK